MDPEPLTLGDRLYGLRTSLGWTLREAAKRADVSYTRLGDWERGQDRFSQHAPVPPYPALIRIARVYGAEPDELIRLAGYDDGLTAEERALLQGFRLLDAERREEAIAFIHQRLARPI